MGEPEDTLSADALRPGTILGRYEIRRLLGQGGMGRVYEAEHRDLKKRVAIKTLLPALAASGDSRERFLREGEAVSRIRHPHVIDVTDVGTEGTVIYLVMEYLEGEDLARFIARQGFLTPAQAVEIMLPVAAAIATAHEQGVIHRDLKPENVFLSRMAHGAIQPKVLDFGISKVLGGGSRGRPLTGTATTMGTINYLPPESLNAARDADARSDQYGLGTILYECVTGQRAFDEASFYQVLKNIAEGRFVRPSELRPGLPGRLESSILRAMSLDPAARFESVRHFGASLLELAGDSIRGTWSPYFGSVETTAVNAGWSSSAATHVAPSGSVPARQSPASSESGRVRTLAAPQSGAGGTIELPPTTPPRKSSSTTMRNANGERATSTPTFRAQRSRIPYVIAGVGLASAIAALALLRGGGGDSGRSAVDQPAVSADPAPVNAPPTPAAPPPALPRAAVEPHPAAPAEVARPEAPVEERQPEETPGKGAKPARATRGSSKKARAAHRSSTAPEAAPPAEKSTSGGTVILD